MSKNYSGPRDCGFAITFLAAVFTVHLQPVLALLPEEVCLPTNAEIIWSDPPDGYVDTRQAFDVNQSPQGIRTLSVDFNFEVDLTIDCIDIFSTDGNPPAIETMTKDGVRWVIELDQPVHAGETTAFAFAGGAHAVIIHSHPGDFNLDGVTDANDLTDLDAAIATGSIDLDHHDYNRDNEIDVADTNTISDILAEHPVQVWNAPVGARVLCCCALTSCSVNYGTACSDNDVEVECPCVPNPCQSQ